MKRLFRFDPPERGSLEMLLMRLLMAMVIYGGVFTKGFFFDVYHDEQRIPNGLAHLLDFTPIGHPEVFPTLKTIFLAALVLYVTGLLPLVSTGYMSFLMIGIGTLRNSQGNIHHGTQLIALVILMQFLAYVWHTWRNRGGKRRGMILLATRESQQQGLQWALQAAVAGYVAAALCKLNASGLMWIWDVPLISVQVMKIGFQHHYDYLQAAPLDQAREMAALIIEHPHLSRLLIGSGLVVELLAFLALFNRTMCFLIGAILWVMHYLVTYVMQLSFPLNEWVLLILFMNVSWVLVWFSRRCGLYDDTPARNPKVD